MTTARHHHAEHITLIKRYVYYLLHCVRHYVAQALWLLGAYAVESSALKNRNRCGTQFTTGSKWWHVQRAKAFELLTRTSEMHNPGQILNVLN